jgi:ribosomal protein L11 methyltransferase
MAAKRTVRGAGSFVWRRWIAPSAQEGWVGEIQKAGFVSWAFMEKPRRSRVWLEVYLDSRAAAAKLPPAWGGRLCPLKESAWLDTRPTPPTAIGRRLEIIHEKAPIPKKSPHPQLHIPHGLAFGSGEHATTFMLLREITRLTESSPTALRDMTVLDLGTGSGVLALAARLFGARKIVATDFDSEAVRTARQNEALNFSRPLIRWIRADVKKLRSRVRYDLVLANLFSGILSEAAPQIAGAVLPGGKLWLSGILKSQEEDVRTAYTGQGLKWIATRRRGKWIVLQWAKPGN